MNIINVIGPLVFVALLGFIFAKTRVLSSVIINRLSQLTFTVCIPALLFHQMATADLSQHFSITLFSAFYLPVLICYGVAWILSERFHRCNQQHHASGVFALSASYSNNVIVGFPVLLMAFGEQVSAIVFLIVMFHSAMLFGLTSMISNEKGSFNAIAFIKRNFGNPLLLSIFLGILFNFSQLVMPAPLALTLIVISKPAIYLALFVLGAALSFYQINNNLRLISLACSIKLLFLPLLVLLFSHYLFSLPTLTTAVLVVMSASPTGVNAYLVAKHQQAHQETTAAVVAATSLLATVTIPIWLMFMGQLVNL